MHFYETERTRPFLFVYVGFRSKTARFPFKKLSKALIFVGTARKPNFNMTCKE